MPVPNVLENLRDTIRAIEGDGDRNREVLPFGLATLDSRLSSIGLRLDALHEVAVADLITDLTHMLRSIGDIDLPSLVSRGDGATHAGTPDRGDPEWKYMGRTDYYCRDQREPVMPIKSHDFH